MQNNILEHFEPRLNEIRLKYLFTRHKTEDLVQGLSPEDCQAQSMPDASPAKWHLAHTTWFFETMVLKAYVKDYAPWNQAFAVLFNSYYQAVGDKHPRPKRGLLTRPTLEEVKAWRAYVDKDVLELLNDSASTDLLWLIELGIQHEQQHQELLLTDIKHLLSCNPMLPAYQPQENKGSAQSVSVKPDWIAGPHGVQSVGIEPHAGAVFYFDNEAPRHRVFLNPYEISNQLVTNFEWLQFIEDGGYQDYRWWLDEGWSWVNQEKISQPLYWNRELSGWYRYSLNGHQILRQDHPVCHVSFYEADAYARWKSANFESHRGVRLPTEFEWEALATPCLDQALLDPFGFMEGGYLDPQSTSGENATQAYQLYGNVWQWTSSPYIAYPGYKPWAGNTSEYNGKFMINQMVLRGGSCLTPRSHIRPTYRNFFPAASRWQMTGFRLARDIA